jgi:hypothetical protein
MEVSVVSCILWMHDTHFLHGNDCGKWLPDKYDEEVAVVKTKLSELKKCV